MDIISEKRALMSYNAKRDNILMFTYKDIDRGLVDPGLLGIKIGKHVMYAEIISNQENRYLMGVIIKSLRSHYQEESDLTNAGLVNDLISLGFHLVGISNIRQRAGTLLHDFDTTYPEYLKAPRSFKRDTFLGTVSSFLKRSRFKVNLAEVERISSSSFVDQVLVPNDFHAAQSIICVQHHERRRVMLNFDHQLWLTNIHYCIEDYEKIIAFFDEVVNMANLLKTRHSNENIYHRIFASLTIFKLNSIEFRPAIVTRNHDGNFVLNHRPYLYTDRSLSKEHYTTLEKVLNKLSILSKEVEHDRTEC